MRTRKTSGWLHLGFLAATVVAMVMVIGPVAAGETLVVRAPPRTYLVNPDPFRLKVTVYAAPLEEIQRLCRVVTRHSHGDFCTQPPSIFRRSTWNPCVMYLPAGYSGEARAIILRHTRAECYGWRHF